MLRKPVSSSFIKCALILFTALAVLPAAQAQAPGPESPLAGRFKAFGLENVKDIAYFDEKNVAITREQFEKQVAEGRYFHAMVRTGAVPSATFTLASKDHVHIAGKGPIWDLTNGCGDAGVYKGPDAS